MYYLLEGELVQCRRDVAEPLLLVGHLVKLKLSQQQQTTAPESLPKNGQF